MQAASFPRHLVGVCSRSSTTTRNALTRIHPRGSGHNTTLGPTSRCSKHLAQHARCNSAQKAAAPAPADSSRGASVRASAAALDGAGPSSSGSSGGGSDVDAGARRKWSLEMRGRMASFVGPALVVPMGEPLMNVCDSICLGQFAGTAELASMGPALIVFAFAQYVFQALQISTVTLISEDLRLGDAPAAQRTLACALAIAAAAGLAVAALLEVFAEQLIAATGAAPALHGPASAYVRIRAVAQPAVLTTMVLQAALIAQQDSVTPATTTAAAVGVSLVGNVVAVGWLGMGIVGAAATTVATQLVGVGALAYFSATKAGRLRPSLAAPSGADLALFARTMGPLAVAYVCKNLCYLVLQTAAAGLETARLAAHQAVFSFWNLLAFTTACLEQVALAFVPSAAPGWRRKEAARLVLVLGAAVGAAGGLAAASVPALAPWLLTRDAAVWPHMSSIAPLSFAAMALAAADVAATGVLLACRDLRFVACAFAATLAGLAAFMAAQPTPRTLEMVWHGCVFFFGARMLQSNARLAWMWRTGKLDARAEGEEESGEEEEEEEESGGGGGGSDEEGTAKPPSSSSSSSLRKRVAQSQDPSGGQIELSP